MVKSTLAAEAASLAIGQDRNEFARVAVAFMFGLAKVTDKRPWQQLLAMVPGTLAVDAKSLADLLCSEAGLPQEKRVALDTA
eukprot:4414801-Prorocentrum_lima.AAC.1